MKKLKEKDIISLKQFDLEFLFLKLTHYRDAVIEYDKKIKLFIITEEHPVATYNAGNILLSEIVEIINKNKCKWAKSFDDLYTVSYLREDRNEIFGTVRKENNWSDSKTMMLATILCLQGKINEKT